MGQSELACRNSVKCESALSSTFPACATFLWTVTSVTLNTQWFVKGRQPWNLVSPFYCYCCMFSHLLCPAPDLTGIFDAIPFRVENRFPPDAVRFNNSSATNPIGLAWLVWNSPGGVTHDVWVQLITAYRRCSGGCDRVRTFKAHLDHLQEGPCAAFGDEAAGILPVETDEGNAA